MSAPANSIVDPFTDNWKIRRRVMFIALSWMACHITWMLIRGPDDALHQQAVLAFVGAMMSIICAYVFGAVWDDHNKRMHFRAQPDSHSDDQPYEPEASS